MARHHGQMTSTPSWHVAGPPARDDLAAWTTATLDDGELGEIPGLSQPAPPGRTELVSGGGVNVRVRPGPAGPTPAFYVHGLGGASTDWTRLSAALATRATGYSIDLPGSGRSDPPPGGRYSPAVDARVVAATIERVAAGPVHLVGNSYGGVITTLVAARWPHLVRSLTVLAPAVPDLRLTTDRGADPRLGILLMPGTAAVAYQRLASIPPKARAMGMGQLCFGRPEAITDRDYVLATREHAWRGRLPWVHEATIGTLRGLMSWYLRGGPRVFRAAAGRVAVPTLVIWGTRDRLVDVRLARRAAAAYPDARLLVLAGCGHVPQMEEPECTARAILARWRDAANTDSDPGRARGATFGPGAPPRPIPCPVATS
jgi:pimeloyl-ACP methyl ester carboxylesterase